MERALRIKPVQAGKTSPFAPVSPEKRKGGNALGVIYNLVRLSEKLDGKRLDRAASELIRRYNGNPEYQGLRKCRRAEKVAVPRSQRTA